MTPELPLSPDELRLWWTAYNAQVFVQMTRKYGGGMAADQPVWQARKAVLEFRGRQHDVLPRLEGPVQEHRSPLHDWDYARASTRAMHDYALQHTGQPVLVLLPRS